MQLSFRHKEQLFHELAQLSQSGVPLLSGLDLISREHNAAGRAAKKVRDFLQNGSPASEAFTKAGFSARDASVVEAGEQSGRLEQIFRDLSSYYEQLRQAKQMVLKRLYYPLFILHFGVLMLALPGAVSGGPAAFATSVIPTLGGVYLAALVLGAGFWIVIRSLAASPAAARVWLSVPLLGGFLNVWTAWNFSLVLALYIRAGGGLLKAFQAAGRSSANAALAQATSQAVALVKEGTPLAAAFRAQRDVPLPIMRAVEIGEHSGRLDSESVRAADQLKGIFFHNLDLAAEWMPRLIYVGIVLLMAYRIVGMFFSIGDEFNSILGE